jgi:hypothetical protein
MKIKLQIFFLLLTTATFGQPDSALQKTKKNNIQVNVGFAHSRLIDEGFTQSKLLFKGTNFKAGLGYGRKSNKYIFNFLTSFSKGKVSTKESKLPTDFANINASLDYLRSVKVSKEHHFFAGLQLSTINHIMQSERIFDNIDAFSLHGVYLNFLDEILISKKQSIQILYSMPAVVYENRALWNGGASTFAYMDQKKIFKLFTTHGKYSYFNLINNIQLKIDYSLKIGKNTDFNIIYRFFYFHDFIQAPIHIYSNELLFGLKFKL